MPTLEERVTWLESQFRTNQQGLTLAELQERPFKPGPGWVLLIGRSEGQLYAASSLNTERALGTDRGTIQFFITASNFSSLPATLPEFTTGFPFQLHSIEAVGRTTGYLSLDLYVTSVLHSHPSVQKVSANQPFLVNNTLTGRLTTFSGWVTSFGAECWFRPVIISLGGAAAWYTIALRGRRLG